MMTKRRTLSAPEVIAKKRDGQVLSEADIHAFIEGFTAGTVPDYQATAFAMAVVLRGMTFDETVALTLAMRDSGRVLRLGRHAAPIVDKHSTGGVGDKVTICLTPIVAACGAIVPTMSGRGLGHTGGTLDKLESISGFRVALDERELKKQLRQVGSALIGQTEHLAPADRRLYALRDVTATVESIPLITASILSKKLAAGIDNLVLDVKVGRGAFMKSTDSARELARSLVHTGRLAGMNVSAVLTEMDAPLGMAVGNALETVEALSLLHGQGPEDLEEVTFAVGAEMLRIAGIAKTKSQAIRRMRSAVEDGSAAAVMRAMVRAQGGDPRVVDEPDRLPSAKHRGTVTSPRTGFVREIDALEVGIASMKLGAGRTRAEDSVDPTAGIVLSVKRGDRVDAGSSLATLHASKPSLLQEAKTQVLASFRIGGTKPKLESRIIETMRR
ncbi:MAG: thymidine phosphorylase [Myxococcota bacterium]